MAKLYVVGFGPGDLGNMTERCADCLRRSDVIVGYTGYTRLLRPLFPGKTYFETGMTKESERCREAVVLSRGGKTVSVVSSGDSGVYGMAGLIFELTENIPGVEIEIIPGVTAALGGASLLGAPIGHDFAVISLSDLLTPWELIARRLRAAASGDFAICLYNPGSGKRGGHLRAACDILLESIPSGRLCGVARSVGRSGQSVSLLTLGELRAARAGMDATVFIGNSQTRNIGGRMVTPRGYRDV